jgi:dipeptidyl aminopeptidase/acylaminoacyl peptidase
MHGSISEPTNIYLYTSPTSMRALTDHNKNLLDKVRMSTVVETFNFTGARNETVWGWHVQPVNGTAQKAPLAFLIHGGPQSSWYDAWSNQWNFQTFSSQGYAVIAINFHGSDSYGQNFTDSIRLATKFLRFFFQLSKKLAKSQEVSILGICKWSANVLQITTKLLVKKLVSD